MGKPPTYTSYCTSVHITISYNSRIRSLALESRYHIASHLGKDGVFALNRKFRKEFLANMSVFVSNWSGYQHLVCLPVFSLERYRKRPGRRQLWALSGPPAIRSRDDFLHQVRRALFIGVAKSQQSPYTAWQIFILFASSSIRVINDSAGQTWKNLFATRCWKYVV